MSWSGSDRRARLPYNWESLRKRALARDFYRCQLNDRGCLGTATEVDHKVAGDDHRLENLQGVCSRCHSRKSAREGGTRAQEIRRRRRRPQERHPGSR